MPLSQYLPPQAQFGSMSQAGAPAILAFNGDVSVVSTPQPTLPLSQRGDTVPNGYRIVTRSGADATLTLPDGSHIHIREMSILELNGFAWDSQINSRGMLMSLYAGSVQVLLSQAYQEQERFFEIKTPNALVSLHFSQPDVEVIYAPSPMENMLALLEEGATLEEEEEMLWEDVLIDRKEDFSRRQRRQRRQDAPVKPVVLRDEGTAVLSVEEPVPLGLQEALAQIGVVQSEEDILWETQLLQRIDDLTSRYPRLAAILQGAGDSTSGRVLPDTGSLPVDIDLDQWRADSLIIGADGLIIGEDDLGKGTTFVFAHTVNVSFMNRFTRETRTIQAGQRAIIRGLGVTMTVLNGNPMSTEPLRDMETRFEFESLRQAPSSGKPGESSILSQVDASSSREFPDPIGRPEYWGNRPRPHNVEIIVDEKTKH